MTAPLKLTRLLNADGEVVGWFSDHIAEMAARREWNEYEARTYGANVAFRNALKHIESHRPCHSIETPIAPAELEDVEPGDGDRVDYVKVDSWMSDPHAVYEKIRNWSRCGAASVEVSRHLINRYRRPGMSSRDADLGGPVEVAGVLYVLRVKAPK